MSTTYKNLSNEGATNYWEVTIANETLINFSKTKLNRTNTH